MNLPSYVDELMTYFKLVAGFRTRDAIFCELFNDVEGYGLAPSMLSVWGAGERERPTTR